VQTTASAPSLRQFNLRRGWLLLVLLALIPTQALAWWQTDWSYRKQITIDTTPKGADISQAAGRVPVLVRLHTGNFSFGDAQDNGNDIRFIGTDDKTPLPFHIESFDPLLGVADVWVDIPDFPAGSVKQIWLYYGNKKAPPAADIAGTFDADYTLVYHFDDGAGAPPKDKTAYGNNAQNAPLGIDDGAIIGKGARFAGAGPITVPASPSLAISPGGAFTFSTWVKLDAPQPRQGLYVRGNTGSALVIGLDSGTPFAEVQGSGAVRVAAPQPIAKGQWTQIALTANGKAVTLYMNGKSVATAAGVLPPLNSVTGIGGVPPGLTLSSPVSAFAGEMDELRLSKVARSAAVIRADFFSQGPDSRLVQYGVDEKQAGFGFGYFGIIVKSVTIDAWVVIGILGVMAVISWFVMFTKASYVNTVDKANDAFVKLFREQGGDPLAIRAIRTDATKTSDRQRRQMAQSSIWRIYHAASDEIHRRTKSGRPLVLNAEAIEVIRAIMDASMVRENQRLARSMVLLTISISGGPFLGLLGTVVGVMITFAAIAASGDVNVNAIAPGISAALLATVAGLAVAIPALFGYNYLVIRNKNISANMQVFVDEFITRVAEIYSASEYARAAE
jgi:biopolymer transport protein ExbB